MPTEINIALHRARRRRLNPLLMILLLVYALAFGLMLNAPFVPVQDMLAVAAP